MFRGDLVMGTACMAEKKDRDPRVDNSIGILDRVVGRPLRGYRGESRRDLGCSCAGRMGSSPDRESIHRCSARIDPR